MSANVDVNEGIAGKCQVAVNRSLARVFGLMFLGLLASGLSAFFVAGSPEMQAVVYGHPQVYVFIFAPLAFVIALRFAWRMSPQLAFLLFFAYSFMMGLTLSTVLLIYEASTIWLAFVSAAGMFGGMAILGLTTKKDLTSMGSYLRMALIGLIIASLVNRFFGSSGSIICIIIPYATIAIFLGLTAHDVQRIRAQILDNMDAEGNVPAALSINGALHLYLDFMNIFLSLLRILGRRR